MAAEHEDGADFLNKKAGKKEKNLIDTKLIVHMLPGLKTYQEP